VSTVFATRLLSNGSFCYSISANGTASNPRYASTHPTCPSLNSAFSVSEGSAGASSTLSSPPLGATVSLMPVPDSGKSSSSRPSNAATVGGALGGLTAIVLFVALLLFYLRRKRKTSLTEVNPYTSSESSSRRRSSSSPQNQSSHSLLPDISNGMKGKKHPRPVVSGQSAASSSAISTSQDDRLTMEETNLTNPLASLRDNPMSHSITHIHAEPSATFAMNTPATARKLTVLPRGPSSDPDLRRELETLREEVRRLTAMQNATPSVDRFSIQDSPPRYEPGRSPGTSSTGQ
jgi:hypothetical protein